MSRVLKRVINRSSLQELVDSAFLDVSRRTLERGRTWTRQGKVNVGPAGHLDSTSRFRLQAVEGDRYEIAVSMAITVPGDEDEDADESALHTTAADLDVHEGSGTIWFDARKGRIARSTLEQRIRGTVTATRNHSTVSYQLSQHQRTNVRTTDQNPVKQDKEEPRSDRQAVIQQKRQELERARSELEQLEAQDRQERQIERLEQELEQNKRERERLERELAHLRKEHERSKGSRP
jgi:hypothetical protein